MRTSQLEANPIPKHKRLSFRVGCFAILLILPFLFYYGYCWGLWGRSSLLLQHLLQCKCPPSSGEWRYPEEVDVVVSACRSANVRLSPSGRLLYIREKKPEATLAYLLNLENMKTTGIIDVPFTSFLTDDLWFVELGLESYVIDRTNGKQYLVERFRYSDPDGEVNGETNLAALAQRLQQAGHIFLTGSSKDTVVAIAADFPNQSFIVNKYDIPDFNMERFLQENDIAYQMILPSFPHEAVSFDGRFIARDDGIYLVGTNQIIVESPPSLLIGWIFNSKAAIYHAPIGRCLVRTFIPFADDVGCLIDVDQPVLLLRVPEEYLSSTP